MLTKMLYDSHILTPATENQYLIKKLYSSNRNEYI